MINFKQVIDDANKRYLESVDAIALDDALCSVEELLTRRELNESNRANGEALRMRLACKILLLKFLETTEQKYIDKLSAFVGENEPIAVEKGYAKSLSVMHKTLDLVTIISKFLKAKDELSALGKSESVLVSGGGDLVGQAQRLIDDITALDTSNPFGDGVACPDLKITLGESLESWKVGICNAYARALERSVPYKKLNYGDYDYFPVPEYDEGGKANAIILNTPFADEARLYAAHVLPKGVELFEFDANAVCDTADGISRLVSLIQYKNCASLIVRAEMLSEDKQQALLKSVMLLGKSGKSVFVIDPDGGALYDRAMLVAAAEDGLSALDISTSYITMPSFNDVCDELIRIKLATEGDCRDKLKDMPFLGFMGLCDIVRPEHQKNWHERGKKISAGNAAAAKRYLQHLKSSMLFIDSGWGDFKGGVTVTDDAGEFDYDDIKDLDVGNIRSIIESGASIFGLCGMVARYCTTGTGDISDWEKLSREQMEERMTLAVNLVYRILRVPIVPVVEVLEKLENDTAGGTCYDGGKRIVFKYDCCVGGVQWSRDAIVHECFHALQAKLTAGNWSQWYYDNMGISYGRVCKWKETRERAYNTNTKSDIYGVHMYEADARAFEIDCKRGMEYYWNTVEFD